MKRIQAKPKKPVAIVLGGTAPHRELIRNLQSRGFETVLVDHFQYPPAKLSADRHIQQSSLDIAEVTELAIALDAALVISTCVDQANLVACVVGERLGLPIPYSAITAERVTVKSLMKSRMTEFAIRTSRFWSGSDWSAWQPESLTYPLVVKPTDSNGSKGVRRVDYPGDLRECFESAMLLSRKGEVVVEEYVEGREIALDSYVLDGYVHVFATRERRKIPSLGANVQQIYGSFWPARLSNQEVQELRKVTGQIASAFELDNTPLMLQCIVNANGVNVIEFAPRIGGAENYRIIQTGTGADVVDYAVDSFLGNKPDIQFQPIRDYVYADLYIYAQESHFVELTGLDDLLRTGTIQYADCYKNPGAVIGADLTSSNRVGVLVAVARTEEEVLKKLFDAVSSIQVIDDRGRDVLRRDLYGSSL